MGVGVKRTCVASFPDLFCPQFANTEGRKTGNKAGR